MGTCFDAHTLVDMIDMTHIPPQLVPVFSNPRLLEQTFGSLTFLRLHITEEAVRKYQLPEAVLSGNRQKGEAILQNWLTHGNLAMSALGSKMKEKGVTIPAITSLNKSGQGETVHQEDGIVFSSENNIPLFLFDEQLPPLYKVNDQVDFAIGSNPILSFDKDGVYIDRQGYQNPAFWLPFIGEHYSVSITDKSLAPHRYPQIIIPQDLLDGLVGARNPRIVQMGILRYMLGISKENILKKFKAKNG